jgi:polyhydroxyalkanoate synthesis regulator phasin
MMQRISAETNVINREERDEIVKHLVRYLILTSEQLDNKETDQIRDIISYLTGQIKIGVIRKDKDIITAVLLEYVGLRRANKKYNNS